MLLPAGASTCMVHLTGNPIYDAVGSITISGLLGCTAIFLIQQNRSLLLGKPSSNLAHPIATVIAPSTTIHALDRCGACLPQHDDHSQESVRARPFFQHCLACNGLA